MLEPQQDTRRASRVSTAAGVFGLGLGPVLAGVLAQYGPLPVRLPYAVYLGLLGVGRTQLRDDGAA